MQRLLRRWGTVLYFTSDCASAPAAKLQSNIFGTHYDMTLDSSVQPFEKSWAAEGGRGMGWEPVSKGLRERRTGGRGGRGSWRAATRASPVGSAVSACQAPSTAHACVGRGRKMGGWRRRGFQSSAVSWSRLECLANAKQEVLKLPETLPEEASIEDIQYHLHVRPLPAAPSRPFASSSGGRAAAAAAAAPETTSWQRPPPVACLISSRLSEINDEVHDLGGAVGFQIR